MESDLFSKTVGSRCKLIPRPYQQEDHDESFRQWDNGTRGTLTRAFTGAGKTPMACLKMATWLGRGPDYRVLVVSYEKQLVWQFAQEIEDFLSITPGIEMEKECVDPGRLPLVIVACRASLLRAQLPESEQLEELAMMGIRDIGACDKRSCAKMLRHLRKGIDPEAIRDEIAELNNRPEVVDGFYSRVHKFDWRLNWLVVYDEAHRHAKHLTSVGHIVDWFDRNPHSKRTGMTATPKRFDQKSIGDVMFPGISIDYPLFSNVKACGVKDGWAVPYMQKYIEVEGVDFKKLKKIAGDFDVDELDRVLGEEATLAKLIEPLLELVGERRALVFNPGVNMAKNVALYINARCPVVCPCGLRKWYARKLIGDGAQCPCGKLIEEDWIVGKEPQAQAIWGAVQDQDRKEVYRAHQAGGFQFLSVCGLCREGYNDPDIGCIAVFRPVSKKASSLAEQMKGRGCRPPRYLLPALMEAADAGERCRLIAESSKPYCLIVDLVGITGLADCASTVQIYSEGLSDEVQEKATEILAERGMEEETGVEDVIEEAKRLCAEEKERLRQEREEAERRAQEEYEKRAKAEASVRYTTHDVGVGSQYDSRMASPAQMKFIRFLGMDLHGIELTKKQAGRVINLLRVRKPVADVARECWLKDGQWSAKGPSMKQLKLMNGRRIPHANARSGYDASCLIDARMDPGHFEQKKAEEIAKCRNGQELDAIGKDILLVKGVLPPDHYYRLVSYGKAKRYSWKGDAAE